MRNQSQKESFAAETLSEAMALRLAGRMQEAKEKLQTILSVWPGHEAANLAMAELSVPSADNTQKLLALQTAAQQSNDVNLWARYVFELRMAGQKSKARKTAHKANVTTLQRKALVQIAEGKSAPIEDIARLINQGSIGLAWRLGSNRQKHFPQDHRLLNLLGAAALADENATRAETVLRKAVSLAPEYEAARANLAFALLKQNRPIDAITLLEGIAARTDASFEVKVNLASAYLQAEQLHKADELTDALYLEKPDDTEVIGIRCKTLIALDQPSKAEAILHPLSKGPNFELQDVLAEAIQAVKGKQAALTYLDSLEGVSEETEFRIATMLAETGALENAAIRARKLAKLSPGNPAPFRLFGLLSKWTPKDELIEKMAKNAENTGLPGLKRGTFGLAYAKALMDLKEYDAAMIALTRGNDALRTLVDYAVDDDEQQMTRIASLWNAQTIQETETNITEPQPIFIVGLPRSGSTLLETILSLHPDVDSRGESPIAFVEAAKARFTPTSKAVAQVARSLRDTLAPSANTRVVTDKLLANFLNVGVLAAAFPAARFVSMQRDYRATCFSIYSADLGVATHPYAMNLEELARYAVAQHGLMHHWQTVLGARMIKVDYAKLVTAPGTEIPSLLKQLDLSPNQACLSPEQSDRNIKTMSVGQARKPISTGSIERWKHYEKGLRPLTTILNANQL